MTATTRNNAEQPIASIGLSVNGMLAGKIAASPNVRPFPINKLTTDKKTTWVTMLRPK
ncbi:conserved hypothetical protein [Listeria innocua FSL S4-378]|nr:conserved hypothetical protein [Listeria innocua FSL S4-378]